MPLNRKTLVAVNRPAVAGLAASFLAMAHQLGAHGFDRIIPGCRFAGHRLIAVLSVLSFALAGCGRLPTEAQIRADFSATEPHATVLNIRHTEGDSDHIYFEVEFTRGTGSPVMVCEMGAEAVDSDDGRSYNIFHRSTRQKTPP